MPHALVGASLLALLATGCAIPPSTVVPEGLHSPFTGYQSELYRDDDRWLCRPDLPNDVCHADTTATELRADGSRAPIAAVPAAPREVDCFYVYPTVDMGLVPQNHTDLDDVAPARDATRSQASLFREVCNLYVPRYRQVTIGTYLVPGAALERRSEVAFSDVKDAFLHYMGQYNHGHKVVLLGHSQGADMVVRLLESFFEHDALMRSRLLVAMPLGGPVEVPKGKLVGGTFTTLPLCSAPDELACVVAFQSRPPAEKVGKPLFKPKPGNVTACVNPAPPTEHGVHRFSRSFFPVMEMTRPYLHGIEGISTPFVMMRDFYASACSDGLDGYAYLTVAQAPRDGDRREGLLDLGADRFNGSFGLHVADFQFAMGDLIDLVARKARRARP
jgi:hypothetical protein